MVLGLTDCCADRSLLPCEARTRANGPRARAEEPMVQVPTVFGSLNDYEKGGVEIINGDPRHYVFSNMFEVAGKSKPYERVVVGKNLNYVQEVMRAEGVSSWMA